MAGAIMDKIWGVIGMNNNQSEAEEPENDDYEVDTYDNYEEEEEDRKFFGRKGKVVPISQAQQVKNLAISTKKRRKGLSAKYMKLQ